MILHQLKIAVRLPALACLLLAITDANAQQGRKPTRTENPRPEQANQLTIADLTCCVFQFHLKKLSRYPELKALPNKIKEAEKLFENFDLPDPVLLTCQIGGDTPETLDEHIAFTIEFDRPYSRKAFFRAMREGDEDVQINEYRGTKYYRFPTMMEPIILFDNETTLTIGTPTMILSLIDARFKPGTGTRDLRNILAESPDDAEVRFAFRASRALDELLDNLSVIYEWGNKQLPFNPYLEFKNVKATVVELNFGSDQPVQIRLETGSKTNQKRMIQLSQKILALVKNGIAEEMFSGGRQPEEKRSTNQKAITQSVRNLLDSAKTQTEDRGLTIRFHAENGIRYLIPLLRDEFFPFLTPGSEQETDQFAEITPLLAN